MPSRITLSRADLERLHPEADLDDFVPTHHVELVDAHTGRVLAEDAVALGGADGGVRFGYVPGDDAPKYGVISSGKWQSLERHGAVRARAVRYVPDYVPPLERDGFVYFVESGVGGPVKIGWSQDVERRVTELQTANAMPLRLLGKIPGRMCDEGRLHERFAHLRMEAEWFQNSSEILEFLANAGGDPSIPRAK